MTFEIASGTCKTSDSCTIAYRLRKAMVEDAPRLALIHSLSLDGSIWDDVAALLAPQADLLIYDCRGHGRSGRPKMDFTTDLFARDLAELLGHLGWETASVVGCSMGGCVALGFAGHYPEKLTALGLIDTTAWYGPDGPKKWAERVKNARAKGFAALADFQASRWFGDEFRAAHPDIVKTLLDIYCANDMDCYAASCMLLGHADLRGALPKIRVPTAIMVGDDDQATPLAMSQQMHEAIADSTLTVLANARHQTPVETPEQIAAGLQSLLRQI